MWFFCLVVTSVALKLSSNQRRRRGRGFVVLPEWVCSTDRRKRWRSRSSSFHRCGAGDAIVRAGALAAALRAQARSTNSRRGSTSHPSPAKPCRTCSRGRNKWGCRRLSYRSIRTNHAASPPLPCSPAALTSHWYYTRYVPKLGLIIRLLDKFNRLTWKNGSY